MELSWNEDDDITNIFKVINIGGSKLVFRLLYDYKETNDNFLFPYDKYIHVVPFWYFYCVYVCLHSEGSSLSYVVFIALSDFLSHYNKKYWRDKSMCPQWTSREKQLLLKFLQLRILPSESNREIYQNLFPLVFERIDPDASTDVKLMNLLHNYMKDCPFPSYSFLKQEFDAIEELERNQERNERLRKLLIIVETIKVGELAEYLLKILADPTELLTLREMAMRCALSCEETFQNFYIAEILSKAPYSLWKMLLLQLRYYLNRLVIDLRLLELICKSTIEFKIESASDVKPFLLFLSTLFELQKVSKLIKNEDLVTIISQIAKYPFEEDYFKIIEIILGHLGVEERMALAVRHFMPGFIDFTSRQVLPESMAGRFVLCLRLDQEMPEKQLLDDIVRKQILDSLLFYFRSITELTAPARLIISYQMYDFIDPISPGTSNMDYLFNIELNRGVWNPHNSQYLISIICDYIVKGVQPPNFEKLILLLLGARMEKRYIYIYAGLLAHLDMNKAVNFIVTKSNSLNVRSFAIENLGHVALIQTGIIDLAIKLLEINWKTVDIGVHDVVTVENTMLRSKLIHLQNYMRMYYTDYYNNIPATLPSDDDNNSIPSDDSSESEGNQSE